MNPGRRFLLVLIRGYQRLISFDHGILRFFYPDGFCRFRPTCSEYGRLALERFGLIRGGFLATKRICRCHPWSSGGIDEVPLK